MRHKFKYKSEEEIEHKICSHSGCTEKANYPAPKNRSFPTSYNTLFPFLEEKPSEKLWLCLKHVREYNQKWDFFAGMDTHQIDSFYKDAITGHRLTWKNSERIGREKLDYVYDAAYRFSMGLDIETELPERNNLVDPETESGAMRILGLSYPINKTDMKSRYRELAKKLHPDKNNGGKISEEKLKTINIAYAFLKNCVNV